MTIKQDKEHILDTDTFGLADQILKDIPVDPHDDPSGEDSGCYDSSDAGVTQQRGTAVALPGSVPSVPHLRMGPNRPGNEKLILNVGGKHFMTFRSTLECVPHTRISDLDELDPAYDFQNDEYFFDRNPKFFSAILDFFRTGELHFAHCLCGPSIKKELDFWGVRDSYIANCCWRAYKSYEEEQETLEILDKTLDDGPPKPSKYHYCKKTDGSHTPYCEGRKKLWDFLDAPTSSVFATAWAVFILLMILISIALVTFETHPTFRVEKVHINMTTVDALSITNPKKLLYYTTEIHPALKYMENICVIIFTIELCFKFFGCPSKLEFWKSIHNIIDVLCVLPMLSLIFIDLIDPTFWHDKDTVIALSYLSITGVLRVFRLFKVGKHYKGLRILLLAVRSSLRELLLLFLLIFMGMLLFSTLIYFAEFETETNEFGNIPVGFWWSIITMTTVGYGDMSPRSGWGYLIGGMCAIAGMLATGLPIPIIASNFNHYHAYSRYRAKLSNRLTNNKSKTGKNGEEDNSAMSETESPAPLTATTIINNSSGNKISPVNTTSSV